MKWLHVAGGIIAVIGVAFVSLQLWEHADEIAKMKLTPVMAGLLVAASVASGLLGIALALGWRQILCYLGGALSPTRALRIYGISQIGKYVPGNIFHLVGRQALGQQAGVPAAVMVKSAGWEIGLIAFIAVIFLPLAAHEYVGFPATVGMATTAVLGVLVALALARIATSLLIAGILYAFYLMSQGAVFAAILLGLGGSFEAVVIGAFVIGWLAGLLTPGAPAGIGVRELVLYALLAGVADPGAIAAALVLGRIVNVFGDILFFVVATVIRV